MRKREALKIKASLFYFTGNKEEKPSQIYVSLECPGANLQRITPLKVFKVRPMKFGYVSCADTHKR